MIYRDERALFLCDLLLADDRALMSVPTEQLRYLEG